jgi:hypothetical protein
MNKLSEDFTGNHNAIAAATKGAAPASHVMFAAVLLTIFETIGRWVKKSEEYIPQVVGSNLPPRDLERKLAAQQD